jgi:hypothetical protein
MKIVSDLKAEILGVHGPDLDRGIGSTGRYQERPVGVEDHTRYAGGSPLEGMDTLSGGRVEEREPPFLADSDELAVRAECNAV